MNIIAKYFTMSNEDSFLAPTKIMVWNIANTHCDNEMTPLYDRLKNIISVINQVNPDVLVLLEAGRPSKSLVTGIKYSWVQMADEIEQSTGLTHQGVWKTTSQSMSSGKAVFVKDNFTPVIQIEQLFVSPDDKMLNAELCGSVLKITFNQYTLGIVHFPMPLNKRLYHAKWLVDHATLFDFIAGDMNTFPESGGADILDILSQTGFIEQLPKDTRFTFKGFKHDIITIPNKDMKYHPYSTIVSATDTHTSLVPASWLDHVLSKIPVYASTYDIDETSSDHYPLIIDINY